MISFAFNQLLHYLLLGLPALLDKIEQATATDCRMLPRTTATVSAASTTPKRPETIKATPKAMFSPTASRMQKTVFDLPVNESGQVTFV